MSPFDFVNDILSNKKDIIKNSENPTLAESLYNPFLANKALSFYVDCIQYANEMNQHFTAPNKLQFDYLINTIRQKKRKNQWIKKTDDDSNLDIVCEYYRVNQTKARDIIKILTPENIETIKTKIIKGGVNK